MVTGGRDDARWEVTGGERCSNSLLSCFLQRADEKIVFSWVRNAECNLIPVLLAAAATAGLLLSDASLTWFKKMLLGCSLKDWDNSTTSQNYGLFCVCNFKTLWRLWAASGSCSMRSCFPSPFRKRDLPLYFMRPQRHRLGTALGRCRLASWVPGWSIVRSICSMCCPW